MIIMVLLLEEKGRRKAGGGGGGHRLGKSNKLQAGCVLFLVCCDCYVGRGVKRAQGGTEQAMMIVVPGLA